jgi:hypothetical protein
MNDLFLAASRRQLRFATTKGHITTEDLWALSLKSLDAIAVSIDEQIKPERKSFLENPDAKQRETESDNVLRLEILKAVITVKQDENKAAYDAASKRSQREFINSLIEKKKIGAMENLSIEELQAQLAAMQ